LAFGWLQAENSTVRRTVVEERVRRAFHHRGMTLDPSEDLWSIIANDSRFIVERSSQGTEETVCFADVAGL
jgi:hypothetical protein